MLVYIYYTCPDKLTDGFGISILVFSYVRVFYIEISCWYIKIHQQLDPHMRRYNLLLLMYCNQFVMCTNICIITI